MSTPGGPIRDRTGDRWPDPINREAVPWWRGITVGRLMVGVLVAGTFVGSWIRDADRRRDATDCQRCRNNLFQIDLAIHQYVGAHGCLPPAYIADASGKPVQSWRALIGPYLEDNSFWSKYRFDEPWDGPNNRKFASQIPDCYFCPNHPDAKVRGLTSYFVVTGPGTAFVQDRPTTFAALRDGLDRTILVVESKDLAVNWLEPRDLDIATMSKRVNGPSRPGISSYHRTGANVLFARGASRMLNATTSPEELRALLTIDAGDGPAR